MVFFFQVVPGVDVPWGALEDMYRRWMAHGPDGVNSHVVVALFRVVVDGDEAPARLSTLREPHNWRRAYRGMLRAVVVRFDVGGDRVAQLRQEDAKALAEAIYWKAEEGKGD